MAQTTSIRCDGTFGATSSANFPAGAFSWQLRTKWSSFSSGNSYQNVVTLTLTNSAVIQVYLDTAAEELRVYRSANGADELLIDLTGHSGQWGTIGARWDGSSATLSVWYLDDATDTWTSLTINGTTAAALSKLELAKYSVSGEEPNQLLICTSIVRSGYMTQAECTAQALSDTPISTSGGSGATVNRWWKLDSNANATDSGGNGYNGTVLTGGSTVSDVPYVSDQTVAPDAAITYPTRFEPTVALGTPGALTADYASPRPAGFEPSSVALGTPLALTADFASARPAAIEPSVANGSIVSVTPDAAAPLPSAAEPAVALGTPGAIAPDAAAPAPRAVEPAVALGTPGAITADVAAAYPAVPAPVVSSGGIQTTSLNANNAYGLQRPWDDHMPMGAFTATIQAKILSWAGGSGISDFQGIIAANCLGGMAQIAAQLSTADGASAPQLIRAWEGEEAVEESYYDVNTESGYDGWALYAIRNDGLGGNTEVVMIPKGGTPIVLAMEGDFGRLRQLYLMSVVPAAEYANQVLFASAFIFEEYLDNAALVAQAASSTPLITGASLNTWYPLNSATGAHLDQSGHGYNANPNNIGVTASDSPYISTDQDVAPDAATTKPAAFEPAVALGTPGAITADVASVGARAVEPAVALGTPLTVAPDAGIAAPTAVEPIVQIGGATLTPDTAAAWPSATEPAVALGTPGALTADVARAAPSATEPAVAIGTALQIAPDAASSRPAGVEPVDVYTGAITITPDAASAGPVAPEPVVELNAIILYPDFGSPRDSAPLPAVALGSALAVDVYAATEQPLALVVDIATGQPLEMAPDVALADPVTPLPGVVVALAPPLTRAAIGAVALRSQLPENRITVTARLRYST